MYAWRNDFAWRSLWNVDSKALRVHRFIVRAFYLLARFIILPATPFLVALPLWARSPGKAEIICDETLALFLRHTVPYGGDVP